jgi:uncharacterized LabA/DUF88 family protein
VETEIYLPKYILFKIGFQMERKISNSPWLRLDDRVVLLIDGASTSALFRSLAWDVDFKKLREFFSLRSNLIHARYFSLVAAKSDTEDTFKSLLDFLAYNGFLVETRFVKRQYTEAGAGRLPGSMSVNLALSMVEGARSHASHIVLSSGDGALVPAVVEAQRLGVKGTVLGMKDGDLTSDLLRRQADAFVSVDELQAFIMRE